jgi:hypothetical protein
MSSLVWVYRSDLFANWRSTVSVPDEVVCSHPLFGEHSGEKYQTSSLVAIFPGATYEVTASGRLELLVFNYEDRSDPDAEGIARLFGALTPVFTGERRDLNYHGWLELSGFGRAKFTDGTLVAFEQFPPMQGTI